MELEEKGFLKENNVRLIGTTAQTIKKAEDRQEFKDTMEKIGEPVAASLVVHDVQAGIDFTNKIGYPVVLRPAYTLGGSGGGIAYNEEELIEILSNGLRLSRVGEVLVERCIAGWKEIEYEVMRDSVGNCITVCNMENIDPVGVHTGDSIVVADAAYFRTQHHHRARHHRRMQRTVCVESGQLRVLCYRGKSACQPFFRTGFQSDRLSDCKGCCKDRTWLYTG